MSAMKRIAKAAFDDARADLILRTRDDVPMLFHVYGSILSIASPVFADMFIFLPSQGPSGEIPVVDLPENFKTLDLALRHIYPVPSPKVSQLDQIYSLAEFARKYQVGALEQDVKGYLTGAIGHDPVGVFAIAVAYGYKDIGVQATQSSLNIEFTRLESPFVKHVPAGMYWDLLKYHVECGKAASAVASKRGWFSEYSLHFNGNITSRDDYSSCRTQDFISSSEDPPLQRSDKQQRYGPRCL